MIGYLAGRNATTGLTTVRAPTVNAWQLATGKHFNEESLQESAWSFVPKRILKDF